jgi:predicted xylose isomerase-like sugar epimerase
MVEIIAGTPVNVVAVSAIGKVTGEDYEKILIPALEAALAANDKVRILYHFGPEYTGFMPAAAWDDTRIGLKHMTHYERVAIVSDDEAMMRMTRAFGFMMPGEVRLFSNGELDDALSWVAE